jgi:hypothetical protein
MRIKQSAAFLTLFVFIICMFAACAAHKNADFTTKAYQIIEKSKISYDFITDSVLELKKSNLISDKDYTRIEKYADIYADAHNAAIEAVKGYKLGSITGAQTAERIAAVSMALTKLIEAAMPYMGGK